MRHELIQTGGKRKKSEENKIEQNSKARDLEYKLFLSV